MRSTRYLLGTALAAAMAVGMAGLQGAHAQEQQVYVPKATMKPLAQVPLTGVEGKEVIAKHLAVPPGFVGGKHKHLGPVFVYVLEGTLTVETGGKIETYQAGELYPEPLNSTMLGKNLSTTDDLELLIFQVGDVGKPMMVKVK